MNDGREEAQYIREVVKVKVRCSFDLLRGERGKLYCYNKAND